MKLACSSTAFDRQLRSGDLTQLEWIDLCARELRADGVVFDVAHFPRTDADYLAQVKKMCADLGLTVAALRDDAFLAAAATGMQAGFEQAAALGAPLLCTALPSETASTWSETLTRVNTATSLAKGHNITLAVRNAQRTFASSVHDMKRLSKESDSAWLRFAPDFNAFEAAEEPEPLLPKSVLLWQNTGVPPLTTSLQHFRAFIAIDDPTGIGNIEAIKETLSSLQRSTSSS